MAGPSRILNPSDDISRFRDELRRGSARLVDREDGQTIRLGFGKHIGLPLAEVEPGYLNFCLGKMDDKLTDETKSLFRERSELAGKPRSLF